MVRAARERRAEAKLRACRILAATVFLAEAGTAPHVAKRVKRMTKRLLIRKERNETVFSDLPAMRLER